MWMWILFIGILGFSLIIAYQFFMNERKINSDRSKSNEEFAFYNDLLKWFGAEKERMLEGLLPEFPSFQKSFKVLGEPIKLFPTRYYELQLQNHGSLSKEEEKIYEERDAFNSSQNNLSGEKYFFHGEGNLTVVEFPEFHLPVDIHEKGLRVAKDELKRALQKSRPTVKSFKLDGTQVVDLKKRILNLTTGQTKSEGTISGNISSQGFQFGSSDLSVSFQKGKFSGEMSQSGSNSSLSVDIVTEVILVIISAGKEFILAEKVFFNIADSNLLLDMKEKPELFLRKSKENDRTIAELEEICIYLAGD